MSDNISDNDFWVFGYGSLMWRPDFPFIETRRAQIFGYHRSLCVYSWVHRGTQETPGLVLGLARGGSCVGKAYKVSNHDKNDVIHYLRAREQVTMVYLERYKPIVMTCDTTNISQKVNALCYVIDPMHQQYTGRISNNKQLDIIKKAKGKSGPNDDYLIQTVEHLKEIGIYDHALFWFADQLSSSKTSS